MKPGPAGDGPGPLVVEALAAALRGGLFRTVAAARAGISVRTLRNWLKYAEAGDERFVPVRDAVIAAEADFEARGVALIEDAAGATDDKGKVIPGAWKAQAWLLEKRFPKRYGSRARVEHSGEIKTGPMAGKSDEELWLILHPEAAPKPGDADE